MCLVESIVEEMVFPLPNECIIIKSSDQDDFNFALYLSLFLGVLKPKLKFLFN